MLYDNKVVMLLLGLGVFSFVMLNKHKIKRIYARRLLLFAFYFLMAGWFFSIIEGFFLSDFFNFLEHFSYMVSALIMALWCRKIALLRRKEGL
jgi:hypothetical protein